MDEGALFSLIFAIVGIVISFLVILSPKAISIIFNSFPSFIKKLLPDLSSHFIRAFVIVLISSFLIAAVVALINITLRNSNLLLYPTTRIQIVPNFETRLTWDASVIAQHSMFINLDLQPNGNPSDIAKLTTKFGPGYTFFIVAQLDTDSTTFSAEPKDQMQQPIDQGNFSFHWIATPLQSGSQAVDVVVKGIWISQSNSGKQIEYYLGSYTWHIFVADNTQIFTLGQFNLAQILGYVGSVIVSVAFIQLVITSFGSRRLTKNQAAQPPPSPDAQPPVSNQQYTQQPVP